MHPALEQAFGLPTGRPCHLLRLAAGVRRLPLPPLPWPLYRASSRVSRTEEQACPAQDGDQRWEALPRLEPRSGPFRSMLDLAPLSRFRRSPLPVLGCRLTSITLEPSFFRSSSLCMAPRLVTHGLLLNKDCITAQGFVLHPTCFFFCFLPTTWLKGSAHTRDRCSCAHGKRVYCM